MTQKIAKGLGYDGAFITSESHATRENRPGEEITIPTREGNRSYRYMKAQEAIAIGQVVSMYQFIDNADVDSAASDNTLTGTGDFTANEFNDGTYPSAFVSIDAGTGANQTRAIDRNTGSANKLTLENNAWDTALDATSDYVTYDPNFVNLADSDEVPLVRGVAISAIDANEWGWFQIKGFCPLVRAAGGTDAVVAGEYLVVSTAAGVARGMTNGGSTVDELANAIGKACHASAAADSAGAGVAAILDIV